jgi:Na+-transporting NADH:ubiquinone oxidoreductase subunit C
MADESPAKPFYSVLVLAFFCSLMVAGAAVGLKPLQQENQALDQKKNILLAAGLYDSEKPVDELFDTIETRIVELATGKFVSDDTISPDDYNQLKAAMSDDLGRSLTKEEDVAGIRRLEKYSLVYLARQQGKISQIILPIRGKGLWSTLYGYLAIDGDLTTVNGISFYQHGETPGLGGEIENPRWQTGWKGKQVYDQSNNTAIWIGKGKSQLDQIHQVDGISGATLTINGVNDIMSFWFGESGFQPFLLQLQNGGING